MCVHPWPGPGGLPLALRLSEGLGRGAPSCDGKTCQSSAPWWPATIASRSAQKNVAVRVLKPPPALGAGKRAFCSPRRPDKLISSLSWVCPERCVVLHHRCGHCHFRFACCCGESEETASGTLDFRAGPCCAFFRFRADTLLTAGLCGGAASWLFSSRRLALILLAYCMACIPRPNV